MDQTYTSYQQAREHRQLLVSEDYRGRKIELFRLPAYEDENGASAVGHMFFVDGVSVRLNNIKPTDDADRLAERARRRVDHVLDSQ